MIRVDISEFLPLKEAAVKEFKSEVSIISSKQEKPLAENISKFIKNYEVFYIND